MIRTLKAIALLSFGGCFVLIHALLEHSSWSQAAAMVGALQLSVLFALVFLRFSWRYKGWLMLGVTIMLVIAALHAGEQSLLAVPGIPHAIAFFLLLLLFGSSLRAGHEPFITAGVRRIQDPLPPGLPAYTRNVTWAWCIFFTAQLVTSLILFLWFSDEVWSFFVTSLNLPLVLAMFAAEYAYRVAFVPNRPRANLAKVIRAFSYAPERDGSKV